MYQNATFVCISQYNKTQGVCEVIYIFFRSSLGEVKLSQVSSLWDMCIVLTSLWWNLFFYCETHTC